MASEVAIEWRDSPTMDTHDTSRLRPLIERPETVRMWGQDHRITPRLVGRVFGDGRRLLTLSPIMFRPNYFVVRIDSRQDIEHGGEWLDEIEDAIADEFVDWPWLDPDDAGHVDEDFFRVDWSDGCLWGEMRWPCAKGAV